MINITGGLPPVSMSSPNFRAFVVQALNNTFPGIVSPWNGSITASMISFRSRLVYGSIQRLGTCVSIVGSCLSNIVPNLLVSTRQKIYKVLLGEVTRDGTLVVGRYQYIVGPVLNAKCSGYTRELRPQRPQGKKYSWSLHDDCYLYISPAERCDDETPVVT